MRPLALCAALALVAGCATSEPAVVEAVANVPFWLVLGEEARLDGHVVRFAEVVEDSRCPDGVECVWAGRAVVAVVVDGETATVEVPLRNGTAAPVAVGGLEVSVTALRPYPSVGGEGGPPQAVLIATPAD